MDCVLDDEEALGTGENGRAVLEIIPAAYESAATGRRVGWPWEAPRERTAALGVRQHLTPTTSRAAQWTDSTAGICVMERAGGPDANGRSDRNPITGLRLGVNAQRESVTLDVRKVEAVRLEPR